MTEPQVQGSSSRDSRCRLYAAGVRCALTEGHTAACVPEARTRGDGMSVIGREWTLRWVANAASSGTAPNARVEGPPLDWHGENVKVVPEVTYRGAVDALEEIAAVLSGQETIVEADATVVLRGLVGDALIAARGQ